jgi:hypothetical protein
MAKVIVSVFILAAIVAVIVVVVSGGGTCSAYYCPSGGSVQNDNQHYQPDPEHEDPGIIIR